MSTKEYTTKGSRKQEDKRKEKFDKKKRRNVKMLEFIVRHVTDKTANRCEYCGNTLIFAEDVTGEKRRLLQGRFCGNAFCPMCGWRQAKRDALKISILMKYIQITEDRAFLFLTLTAPNVRGDKLGEEITRYNRNFLKLMDRREVERIVKGYVRKLEITYNKEPIITEEMWKGNPAKHMKPMADYFKKQGLKVGDANPNYDTYHPHFHVLIVVNKSYFEGGKGHISKKRWLELWQEAMNDKTITQVDAVPVTLDSGKAINEIAKYTAKDVDYLYSQEVFDVFYKALKGRQRTTYSGLFADAHKLFKQKKLRHLMEIDLTEYAYWLLWKWGKGEYVETERRELTELEKAEINRRLIDETDIVDEDDN